jgi:hypothetical protein
MNVFLFSIRDKARAKGNTYVGVLVLWETTLSLEYVCLFAENKKRREPE